MSSDDDTLIAAHLAKHGVIRCPTAYALPTTAAPNPADAKEHAKRGDPQWNRWRKSMVGRVVAKRRKRK